MARPLLSPRAYPFSRGDFVVTVMQTKYRINEAEAIDRSVSNELDDIIPCLSEYIKVKQDFREGKTAEQAVIHQAERLTVEINEFITALNAHATETEREIFSKIK